MKRVCSILTLFNIMIAVVAGQKLPTGNLADFKVKTCLYSLSCMGIWRGQAILTNVKQFR
jgi:hypothetical protein